MNDTPLPVTVLSGFTGADKASLVDALLANAEDLRIGAVTYGETASGADRDTTELPNGCMRMTLADPSMDALESAIAWLAQQQRFDAIVVEAPDLADPMTIAEELAFGDDDEAALAGRAHLDTFVTVIDATSFARDYASSDSLAERGLAQASHDDEDGKTVVETLVEQIEFCDVIVIDKIDLAGADEVTRIAHMLHALNPRAVQVQTQAGEVRCADVLNTGRFDFDATASAPGWLAILDSDASASDEAESSDVGHFVYRARRPFHPERLWNLLHREWPGVLRAKGFFWLATRSEVGGSLSQAGGTCRHGPAGVWWAAQDRSEWPTDDPELEAEIVAEWYGDPDDNSIGDRRQELVLIGVGLDRSAWQDSFDACLLTDDEWALGPDAWQRFADPFPAWDIDEHDHEHDHDHDHGPDCDCDDHKH
ncbi:MULTISPECIES: GTP-binding protein [Caballeronia]|uniref:GTP-binding protein n=1 Tax=Caballeronia TaxID=1827195 RepID=UPI00023881D0|nr:MULTISPECIES: GTP-binding protein [unclassified Caballeronia]AET90527.1 putative cobalamin synthesis protein/P47K [Burkholderia sp. YI23]BAO87793.1 putative cobalamin synthesis protein/P47K [Burkholderia sp. RPE67]BBP97717.1 cobalamin biosynthesis protein CobW [Burkholderia sp. SFA1]MCE4543342.1 GTP-binding protein [Caballeronia sp. PC1]MCE4567602.1 GTP-binding protein [Caballeronia sp. CLC5]